MYELGNLALACFVCNVAKNNYLTSAEAKVIGESVRRVWDARLRVADGK